MTKNEALRLALKALEFDSFYATGKQEAITAIKAALEAKDEPVAWMRDDSVTADTIWGKYGPKKVFDSDMPLYTTPPQRKPLTDEEIDQICCDVGYGYIAVARAMEAAHGITGENT